MEINEAELSRAAWALETVPPPVDLGKGPRDGNVTLLHPDIWWTFIIVWDPSGTTGIERLTI